ncbi:hypothetical protein NIES208_13095 [[Limnothrix rosea] IAM M-220]|nr:hypothetical protein NIES208_13095 [[Limnothrix rosea] IAM M-220]
MFITVGFRILRVTNLAMQVVILTLQQVLPMEHMKSGYFMVEHCEGLIKIKRPVAIAFSDRFQLDSVCLSGSFVCDFCLDLSIFWGTILKTL